MAMTLKIKEGILTPERYIIELNGSHTIDITKWIDSNADNRDVQIQIEGGLLGALAQVDELEMELTIVQTADLS